MIDDLNFAYRVTWTEYDGVKPAIIDGDAVCIDEAVFVYVYEDEETATAIDGEDEGKWILAPELNDLLKLCPELEDK